MRGGWCFMGRSYRAFGCGSGAARSDPIVPDYVGAAGVHRAAEPGVGDTGAERPQFPLLARCIARSSAGAVAEQLLGRIGLEERADIRAEDLSHGEQRQLELGMALACEPSVLLLDEPMAGLGASEFDRHGRVDCRAAGQDQRAAGGTRYGCRVRTG